MTSTPDLDRAGRPPTRPRGGGAARAIAALGVTAVAAAPAQAHVKWFAPYFVEAPPQQIGRTLENPWFWTGIALVLVFFLATRSIERTGAGQAILRGIDKLTHPLWVRLDDFMRFVIAAFFVAIFAVGGVYLTPDLETPHEWVSWMQLLIAALVFSRRTRPLAALGIVLLWVLALSDYEFFHLLDYLSLGLAVAAYLVLESSDREEWRRYRFEVLRWGVAIALMWSSLEKFAYPDWFYPLVEEKPFLTFGMPRDVFIPMAGVAEFTMGFGLLWTALVRRLSAVALFVIFNAAVYPFGRIDLVGHALIMAVIVAIAADPTPQVRFALRRSMWSIPPTLVAALLFFSGSYWGLHRLFYGTDGGVVQARQAGSAGTHHATHAVLPAQRERAQAVDPSTWRSAYDASMDRMHQDMAAGLSHGDPDVAFVQGMIAHHEGAIEMARIQLQSGRDPENRALAEHIIEQQEREVAQMKRWLQQQRP
ncbi:DUF305 domain-containing protein [Ramlibacter rhizophilus]|uniref:DUF305 domain-containing protein n=1 Tax=Ramlibacter rhizophilus TaxID=1781167 RepID=A0A4Z0BJL4_9BURK|nr:DUF305 domain-containing protein [Ramlibacter rhizophilus]TFY98619.1 DUF305 domain-containing protein [Ramlibacter rhizophilus]